MKICTEILIENINITCTFSKTKGNHDILFPYVSWSYVLCLSVPCYLPQHYHDHLQHYGEQWGVTFQKHSPDITQGAQGQVGWDPEQSDPVHDLAVGNPACGRGVGTSPPMESLPTHAILW